MITSRPEVANLLNRIFAVQTSKYNLTYNMNIFTWFEWLLFELWSENCWNICHDLQAFIMNDLLVCVSFKYQYSLFANKRIIFKLGGIVL